MNNKTQYAIIGGVVFITLIILRLLTRKRAFGIPIKYQANILPRSIWKSYSTRSIDEIEQVVIHHSLTKSGSPAAYAKYHVDKNGWPGIGYHYVISKEGEIVQTQPLRTVSFHTSGQNTRSIGICLTGDYDVQQAPEVQLDACVKLIKWLEQKELKRSLQIAGHNKYSSKSCPGRNINVNEIALTSKTDRMNKIFVMVFYETRADGTSPDFVNFDFIEGIEESPYTDKSWPGQACPVNEDPDNSCAFSPYEFRVSAIPAYLFLHRISDKQAVLVKKIEGKQLGKADLLQEIADAASAEYEIGNSSVEVDLDGDGQSEEILGTKKKSIGIGLGAPLGSLFDCEMFLPRGVCRIKLGYIALFLMLIIIGIILAKKL